MVPDLHFSTELRRNELLIITNLEPKMCALVMWLIHVGTAYNNFQYTRDFETRALKKSVQGTSDYGSLRFGAQHFNCWMKGMLII